MIRYFLAALLFAGPAFGQSVTQPPVTGTPGNITSFGTNGVAGDSGTAVGPLSTQNIYPETFGAIGNGVKVFDGVVTTSGTVATGQNSGTTLTAPGVTTLTNGDFVLSVFVNANTWSVTPTLNNTRATINQLPGGYGFLIGDQAVPTAGIVAGVSGTMSGSAPSSAGSFALKPSSTISFVSGSSVSNTTTSKPIMTLAKPAGTTAGDYLVACFGYYTTTYRTSLTPTNTNGWSMILSFSPSGSLGNPNLICLGRFAGASEPSNYTFVNNFGAFAGQSAAILDYRGVAGVENMNQTITSVTANFPANAVGEPICVAGEFGINQNVDTGTTPAYYYPQQICGTITAVNSATSVNTSFYLPENGTNLPIAYGNDDTAALQAAINSTPCTTKQGCTIQLACKHYITTRMLTIGQNLGININGCGAALPNTVNNLKGGNTPLANITGGSTITLLAQNLNAAAILIGNATSNTTSVGLHTKYSNFALVGGVGNYADGGGYNAAGLGTDAIDVIGIQSLEFSGVMIANFYGNGVYINGTVSGSASWTENISFNAGYIGMNGGSAIQIGTADLDVFLESTTIKESVIEGNGGPAINILGPYVLGLVIQGNTIQWNNTFTEGGNEINIPGVLSGGFVSGNYFEADSAFGSASVHVVSNTQGAVGLAMGSFNIYYNNAGLYSNGFPLPTYAAAATALPAAGWINNSARVMVSDSTACTAGTTYVSGGSTQCIVVSNGTNWLETGTAY